MTITHWIAEALAARARCIVLAADLERLMGRDRGRRVAWCCRLLACIPSNPGYETLLRLCREMAAEGRLR